MLLSGDTRSAAVWACRKASFNLTLCGLLPAVYGTSAAQFDCLTDRFLVFDCLKMQKKTIALVIFNFPSHIQIEVLWSFNCNRDCLRLCKLKREMPHISCHSDVLLNITYIISSMEPVLLPISSDTDTLSQLLTSTRTRSKSFPERSHVVWAPKHKSETLSVMMHSLCAPAEGP